MIQKSIYPQDVDVYSEKLKPYRIEQLNEDGSNLSLIVKENLINYLRFTFLPQNIGKKYSYFSATRFLKQNVFTFSNDIFQKVKYFATNFHHHENECFDSQESLGIKHFMYAKFFEENETVFDQIEFLILAYRGDIKIDTKTYSEYAKKAYDTDVIDLNHIELKLNYLVNEIVKQSANDLMFNYKYIQHNKSEIDFDFKYYMFHTLIWDKNQLQLYQQSILNWLTYVSYNLKTHLHLPGELPLFLQVIQWMKDEIKNSGSELLNAEYPRFIFRDYQSFKLFHSMATHFKYAAQISYVYRQMYEKENPRLIVVGIKDFIAWFNEENAYPLKLDISLKTFEQSHTHDREAFYNFVKTLIFSH